MMPAGSEVRRTRANVSSCSTGRCLQKRERNKIAEDAVRMCNKERKDNDGSLG
jgi:hypothetical protein